MLLIRLPAVLLVLFTNIGLLNCFDTVRQYKRTMARQADRELSRIAGEPCTSSAGRRYPRQLGFLFPAQHRPLAARLRTRTSHRDPFINTGQPAGCSGECAPASHPAGKTHGVASHWGQDTEWADSGDKGRYAPADSPADSPNDGRTLNEDIDLDVSDSSYVRTEPDTDAHQGLSSGGRVRADPHQRFTRSAPRYDGLRNTSWQDVLSQGIRVVYTLHRVLLGGDGQSSAETPEDVSEDYSGEVDDGDALNTPAVSSAASWRGSFPEVPPSWMSALYFSGGREQLKLKPTVRMELPRAEFSLELWVKPEGGQSSPAVIAGVFDNCSHSVNEKGWWVGIRTVEPTSNKDARFFFTLRTDRAVKSTTVYSHQRYHANAWTHLMATYDGHNMRLYVDGAKVGESSLQTGNLYSSFMKTCRTLVLGGIHSEQGNSFRGLLGGVVLWDHARSHKDLLKGPLQTERPVLAMWADFADVTQLWAPYKTGLHPTIVSMPTPEPERASPLLPPPCGLTLCDNTGVIHSYNRRWQLRGPKRVRYRVVNLSDDDGGNPTVSRAQVELQHRALTEAFLPHNVTLDLSIHAVCNSSLRRRFVLSNCRIGKIGDRQCDPECDHPRTGHDGGDCVRPGPCYNWKRQDGVCHAECNSIYYDYDDGDCCDPEVTDVTRTCFDPESPNRAYMSVKELKEELRLSSADTLNVFFAYNSAREDLAGAATWPWAKEALTHQGGMVLNPSYYGTVGHNNTMIHEMGHVFGLYHVFKGVSERDSCDDPCQETTPSMETGDLCADTAPTPKNKACHDPGSFNDTCGVAMYQDTPYNNYMSYTDDNCTNHFTPNQVARMHCYVDLVYQNWLKEHSPTPVPLSPIVIGQNSDSVTIYWLPPVRGPLHLSSLSSKFHISGVNCRDCQMDGVYHQYAYGASSPRICDTSGYWTPEEAIGPPDVDQPCEPSLQAWSPELSLYDTNVTSPCPETEGCTLTLHFLHPLLPDRLTLWVTYTSIANPALASVELLAETGQSISLGTQHVFCDMPLTVRLDTGGVAIAAVKLSTFDEKMEIDAAMLSSSADSLLCSGCQPLMYRIHRQPPFTEKPGQEVAPAPQTKMTFTDISVTKGVQYKYTVQVDAGGLLSEQSPPLLYTHGQAYCGDGLVQGTEECDDKNLLDGDGCSKQCHKEEGFNCNGEPSECYVFDGDGVCEDFEQGSSVQDCGYFTPLGYTDQWASTATASHVDPNRCPAQAATGEPSLRKLCRSQYLGAANAWFPCTAQSYTHNDVEPSVWLKAGFVHSGVAASVIVYLDSDGSWYVEQCKRTVTILLCDTTGKNHTLGTHEVSCRRNPLVVNVTHDLSQPIFLTSSVILLFSAPYVAVGGVALRTSCHFNSFALTGCPLHPCQVDSCSPPQLAHASVSCTGGAEASRCTIQCNRGYSMTVHSGRTQPLYQRSTDIECVQGSWDRQVSCQLVDCGMPDQSHVYHAIFSCPWGTAFGKQCSFTCGSPAILQGDSDRLVCLEDGLWSSPEAYCKIECPEAPAIANAKLLTSDCLSTGHDVGTVCRYRCYPGFYITGSRDSNTRRKYPKVECLEGGQWEETGCEPVSCPALPDVFQGMYVCTNGLLYDSVCTLSCPDKAENSTIHCTMDGVWTSTFTMCATLQGSCATPAHLNSVEYNCDQGTDIGAVCHPTCVLAADMDLRDPVVLSNDTTADSIKHWMTPPKAQKIVCTGMMRWHPDPTHIYCIQSCEPFGGDGWCDTINNRAFCQYDGGDCCPSTLSTRKVIQFGADCDQDECSCRDPDAEENRGKAEAGDRGVRGK